MRAPKSEWMLWAKKLKDEYAAIQRQVQALECECSELRKSRANVVNVEEPAAPRNEGPANGHHHATNATDKTTAEAAEDTSNDGPTEQGSRGLEQYFEAAQSQHADLEDTLVRNFLVDMNPSPERTSLEACLHERGHTWSNLDAHMQTLIRGGPPRCCRVRRSLM